MFFINQVHCIAFQKLPRTLCYFAFDNSFKSGVSLFITYLHQCFGVWDGNSRMICEKISIFLSLNCQDFILDWIYDNFYANHLSDSRRYSFLKILGIFENIHT
jgi:hypothetical protein